MGGRTRMLGAVVSQSCSSAHIMRRCCRYIDGERGRNGPSGWRAQKIAMAQHSANHQRKGSRFITSNSIACCEAPLRSAWLVLRACC